MPAQILVRVGLHKVHELAHERPEGALLHRLNALVSRHIPLRQPHLEYVIFLAKLLHYAVLLLHLPLPAHELALHALEPKFESFQLLLVQLCLESLL